MAELKGADAIQSEDAQRKRAIDAMLRAEGRTHPAQAPVGAYVRAQAPIGVRDPIDQAAYVRAQAKEAAAAREAVQSPRTVIGMLEEMQARDARDYADLIQSLRDFAGQKRADLEQFERLLGNVERGKRQ